MKRDFLTSSGNSYNNNMKQITTETQLLKDLKKIGQMISRRLKDRDDIPADSPYSPDELDRWLDETRAPLSDDDMKAMSEYFQSESFQYEEIPVV